uniref:Uncharacterized protein n=1 Tax=Aegilops tauschii subsp. strangulata TaxID=200361 RepID=A0A453K524_AEGTS
NQTWTSPTIVKLMDHFSCLDSCYYRAKHCLMCGSLSIEVRLLAAYIRI